MAVAVRRGGGMGAVAARRVSGNSAPAPRLRSAILRQSLSHYRYHILAVVVVLAVGGIFAASRSGGHAAEPVTFAARYRKSTPVPPKDGVAQIQQAASPVTSGGGLVHRFSLGDVRRTISERVLHISSAGQEEELARALQSLPAAKQTLRFEVCNGFANQRLSVVYGIMLAARLQRSPVLPRLLSDGLQRSDEAKVAGAGSGTPFSQIYDQRHFMLSLARLGIRVLEESEVPPDSAYSHVRLSDLHAGPAGITAPLLANHSAVEHLGIDCPLFKLQPAELSHLGDGPFIVAVLDAMKPAPEVGRTCCWVCVCIKGGRGATGGCWCGPAHGHMESRGEEGHGQGGRGGGAGEGGGAGGGGG